MNINAIHTHTHAYTYICTVVQRKNETPLFISIQIIVHGKKKFGNVTPKKTGSKGSFKFQKRFRIFGVKYSATLLD